MGREARSLEQPVGELSEVAEIKLGTWGTASKVGDGGESKLA